LHGSLPGPLRYQFVDDGMPKYFFRLCDDMDCEDPEGMDLPDLQAAYSEPIRGIRSIMADQIGKGRLSTTGRIEIKDETGAVVQHVAFREALVIDS
jgi:hypothetical protein